MIDDQLKALWKVELIFQHLTEMLLVYIVEPMANINIEAIGILVEEDTSARYHGVIVFSIEDRRSVAFGFSTVMLLLPIGLVQLADSRFAVDKNRLLCINLLHAEKSAIGNIIPEDAHLGLPIIHKTSHNIH